MPSLSYDQWLDYTFGLSSGEPCASGPYPGTPDDAFEHCGRFLRASREPLRAIPRAKAVVGLKAIPSIDGYGGLLSWPGFAYGKRTVLADAQVALFSDSFKDDGFDGSAFMWWEYLIGAEWDDGPAVRMDTTMCDYLIGVIEQIFKIGGRECQMSALHGANEVGPATTTGDVPAIVARLTALAPPASGEVALYAETVAEGNAP